MSVKLVLIQKFKDTDTIEMFQYIGKKFQLSVAVSISSCPTKKDLLDLVEDFRLNGEKLLA